MPVRFRNVCTHEDVYGVRVLKVRQPLNLSEFCQTGMAWNQARISEEEETGCQRNGLLVIASGWRRNLPKFSSTKILAKFVFNQKRLPPLERVAGGWAYTVIPKLLLAPLLKGCKLWWSSEVAGTSQPGGVHSRFIIQIPPPWALPLLCWYMPPGSLSKEQQMTDPPLIKLWTKMLMEEKGGKRLEQTHSRAEGEGYEKPNSTFKNNKTFAKSW